MIVKEFIDKVADGTFTDIDVMEYVSQKKDIKSILESLWMADITVLESTGKPQVTDDRQRNRIQNAIFTISERFHIALIDIFEPQQLNSKLNLENEKYPWIIGDNDRKQKILGILKEKIGNETAKNGCKWIRAAIKAGVIIKPTHTQINKEFPSIKKTPYNNQMKRTDDDSEIVPLIDYFK